MGRQVDDILSDLTRLREEIALRIHLGSMDAKKEWERLEKKLEDVKAQSKHIAEVASDSAEGVGKALDLAVAEIKKGYERIKTLL